MSSLRFRFLLLLMKVFVLFFVTVVPALHCVLSLFIFPIIQSSNHLIIQSAPPRVGLVHGVAPLGNVKIGRWAEQPHPRLNLGHGEAGPRAGREGKGKNREDLLRSWAERSVSFV